MSAATNTPRQTWDQRRAAHAWNAVESLAARSGGPPADEYSKLAKETSTRILTAGLGQALAYLLAKASHQPLHNHLADWLRDGRGLPIREGRKLIETIIESDSAFLRRATDETLAYLAWLARFAEARKGE